MDTGQDRYELPESTNSDVRKMVVGLGLFFCALVVLVVLVFYYAQAIAQFIPFSAEKRFVRPYEKLVALTLGGTVGDPEIGEYLQGLADDLIVSMEVPEDIVIKVHYVGIDDINAFATLGGNIVVLSGLLETVDDENSLAMVLAHEIAHVAHRDPLAGVSRGMALELVFGFLTGGTFSTGDVVSTAGGAGLATFSRDQERSADMAAIRALHAHYGHVAGYRSFFEMVQRLEAENPDSGVDEIPDWMASHPETAERLDYLDTTRETLGSTIGQTVQIPSSIVDAIAAERAEYFDDSDPIFLDKASRRSSKKQ